MSQTYNNPKIAVIGAGRWGSNHLRIFSELIGKENLIAYDTNPMVLSSILATNKATITRDLDEAIDISDGVVVSCPAGKHKDLAEAAIKKGKAVLIEKPIALTERDALHIAELGEKHAVIVAVDHLLLHHNAVKTIKSSIESGMIGKPVYVDIERTHFGWRVYGEDALNSLMIHDIYLSEYLFGKIININSAIGTRISRGSISDAGYDDVTAVMTTENGTKIRMRSSWATARKQRMFSIMGTHGSLEWNDLMKMGDGSLVFSDKYIDEPSEVISSSTTSGELPFIWGEPLKAVAKDFINAMTTGSEVVANARDGARAVRMVECIRREIR